MYGNQVVMAGVDWGSPQIKWEGRPIPPLDEHQHGKSNGVIGGCNPSEGWTVLLTHCNMQELTLSTGCLILSEFLWENEFCSELGNHTKKDKDGWWTTPQTGCAPHQWKVYGSML